LVRKSLKKWALGRLERRLEDNAEINLREVVCEDGIWID
jgi:hypothetical protein